MRAAPLSRISRAVIVLPSASLGSETLKRSTMNRVVCRAVSASACARSRCRSASLRASHAVVASVEVITMPIVDAVSSSVSRWRRRCASRCFRSSSPTPSMPASSFSRASCLPSLFGRTSAAIGSLRSLVSSPSGPSAYSSAGGKDSCSSRPGTSEAPGSPPTSRQKMRRSRPSRLKVRISSLTHRDFAAAGEQMTIWNCDSRSARVSVSPRLVAEASSSRSRKIGAKRAGISPCSPVVPTRRFGTR